MRKGEYPFKNLLGCGHGASAQWSPHFIIMEINRIKTMTGGELAEWLHDTYERISGEVGWETQKKCRTKFADLPAKNKSVMVRVAQAIQVELIVPLLV